MSTRADAEAVLRRLAEAGDGPLDLGEGALALAVFGRPRVPLERYRVHLAELAADCAAAAPAECGAQACAAALAETLFARHGYAGDVETYDDLQNANLIRVIDRRKGLPVVLGILMIAAGRAQGWNMAGLAFPGHFLVRLDAGGDRAILDPFHGGRALDTADLRALLKAFAGHTEELSPAHYAAVPDREVLMRVQNNIFSRLVREGRAEAAAAALEPMLMLAPGRAGLWWQAGLLHAQAGNLGAALSALDRFMDLSESEEERYRAARFAQDLRTRLN